MFIVTHELDMSITYTFVVSSIARKEDTSTETGKINFFWIGSRGRHWIGYRAASKIAALLYPGKYQESGFADANNLGAKCEVMLIRTTGLKGESPKVRI